MNSKIFSVGWVISAVQALLWTVLLLVPGQCFGQKSASLYGSLDGKLVRIDPLTETLVTPVGSFGRSISDMAYDTSTGVLFGVSTLDGNLSRINVHTGEATVVGNTDLSIISGLSYDSKRDALYAYAREEPGIFDDNRSFFELNRTDGSASFLSKPEVLISPTAYDAINQSIMGLGINSEGEHVVYSVNPINGNAVQLGSFDNDLNDVAFNAGLFPISLAHDRFTDTAFVVVASNAGPSTTTYGLVSFDKNNGMVVDRMGIGPNRQLSALAFVPDAVPEPSTVSVLSLVSGLLFSRRRREMRRK